MSVLLHVLYAIGKIGYCDFTPAYMFKMTSEENSESKILNVKCTLSCKIGKLPVNDEIISENLACTQQDG